jgi:U3 small nucleolar RNA-associated protein 20
LHDDEPSDERTGAVHHLLHLLGISIEYNGGKKVLDVNRVIGLVMKCNDQNFPLDIMLTLSKISAVLLLSKNFVIGQLESSLLAKKTMNTEHVEVLETFVKNSVNCPQFDILIMPDFIRYFERHFASSSFEILAKIVQQRKPQELLSNDEDKLKRARFESYNIHFKNSNIFHQIANYILAFECNENVDRSARDNFILALQIMPHLTTGNGGDRKKIEKRLIELRAQLLDNIRREENSEDNVYLLAILLTSIENMLITFSAHDALDIIDAILNLKNRKLSHLKVLNYCLHRLKSSCLLDENLFHRVRSLVVDNLLSHNHSMRVITSKILATFNANYHSTIEHESIYEIFKNINEIAPTIQTFREQIVLMQKLSCDTSALMQNVKNTDYIEDVIKFYFGFLHIKFQPLWEPITKTIDTFAVHFDLRKFWTIFHKQIVNSTTGEIATNCDDEYTFSQNEFLNKKFIEFITNDSRKSDNYDSINYRMKLLQILSESKSNVVDVMQRDIVDLFFNFLLNEYRDESLMPITAASDSSNADENDDDESGEVAKGRQKLLISHLQVLAKFSNPNCVRKCKELRKLYTKLLLHRNFQVQKLALDCIIHYKEPSIIAYKDILYNCVSEKTFRQEISALNLNQKISNDHREDFVEIFLPLIFSKLSTKASKKDQDGFKSKKEMIIRFMNHLRENELSILTDIAIGNLSPSTTHVESVSDVMKSARDKFNTVKINELQSKLQFLKLVKKYVAGAFSSTYQHKVLHAMLCISALSSQNESVMCKALKHSCLQSMREFFEQYESFVWTDFEIKMLFEIFIWKYLETFHRDSSQDVSALMRLFVEWSKNPKYFIYLNMRDENDNYAMKSIMALLGNKSTTNVVIDCVMDICERLLSLIADDETVTTVNYGTHLLEPFIPEILLKLKEYLKGTRYKAANLIKSRNLFILSRVTELVKNDDSGSSIILLDILFPLTLKKLTEDSNDSDGIMKLLTTISNLLKFNAFNKDNIKKYLRLFAPLFEHVREVNHRKFLVKIFNILITSNNEYDSLKMIVNDLNAYDKRWIEQPDYEKRINAFHRLENLVISVDVAVIVIYHCFNFLKYDKDLAIRDNSSHYLKLICSKTINANASNKQEMDFFVDKIILTLIQKKLHGSNDISNAEIRAESIKFLGELARNHPNVHPVLNDLHPLTNIKNRELDFFDNITHLQKFRHMKALRRCIEIYANKNAMNPNLRTLTDFLLPLSKTFLCADEYRRKSKVIEAAIEYVKIMCQFLPWHQYESILKFYIRKMQKDSKAYQKQLVKLITSILDAFHFKLNFNNDNEMENTSVSAVHDIEIHNGAISDEEDSEDEDEEKNAEKYANNSSSLSTSMSQRVVRSLTCRLIPSLFRIISELSITTAHKANKEEQRLKEKTEMIKIPIALPLIKLLQKLPPKFLSQYLAQVVLKISSFLKSRLKQVRATARHTLKEILVSIGAEHLEIIIENLSSMLRKGFHLHVLSITIHTLIDAVKSQLISTNITDNILQRALDTCFNDIFGQNNESAQDANNTTSGSRTPEAKPSRKSFLTLNILASTISERSVLDLIMPFKNKLAETQSKKVVIKLQECFTQIASGLTVNSKITNESVMILIHGTITESIPNLWQGNKTNKKRSDSQKLPADCFILQDEPKRRQLLSTIANKNIRFSSNTNSYVLVEFGLEMLYSVLKKKIMKNEEGYLDPLIPLLLKSLKGNFLRVSSLTIQCISIMWHQKLLLDNMKIHIEAIVTEIFSILHKYASSETSRRDSHYLLVKSSFKGVVVLIRHVNYYTLTQNQLKALLLYVEQDLTNIHDKNTISFVLLRAILDKKLIVPELHEIMRKIAEISITSEVHERRLAIRPIILVYLMEYPLGKKIDHLLKFFVAQLNYEEICGRESAIAMLDSIIRQFPQVCST